VPVCGGATCPIFLAQSPAAWSGDFWRPQVRACRRLVRSVTPAAGSLPIRSRKDIAGHQPPSSGISIAESPKGHCPFIAPIDPTSRPSHLDLKAGIDASCPQPNVSKRGQRLRVDIRASQKLRYQRNRSPRAPSHARNFGWPQQQRKVPRDYPKRPRTPGPRTTSRFCRETAHNWRPLESDAGKKAAVLRRIRGAETAPRVSARPRSIRIKRQECSPAHTARQEGPRP